MFTNWQKGLLVRWGFIREEIDVWSKQEISFNSETFKDMCADRRQWKRDRKAEGWSNEQCYEDIFGYFEARQGKSPWDFIAAAYKPPRKLADFSEASRKRAAARRRKAAVRIHRIVGEYG